MKRWILIVAPLAFLLLAICAGAAYWCLREPAPEWTTRSPKAREEFEAGLSALAKMYQVDAIRHFEKALELDPSFAMAKLQLASLYPSRSQRKRLTAELEQVETDRLNDRERLLLSYRLAREEGRDGDAQAVLQAFLEEHPSDLWGIQLECSAEWHAQKWDRAERCYQNLLALHPNWVEAHNNLGYIAVARGRFDEAEEHFRTYRYVAPDQANPHHSLAVLLTVRGRYEEAIQQLDKAVAIKPDFCPAYTQRVELAVMSARFEMAEDALHDLETIEACGFLMERGVPCATRAWTLYLGGDAEGAWRLLDGGCLERREGFDLLAHRIAVMTGRLERAVEMEDILRRYVGKVRAAGRPVHAQFLDAHLAHMEGIRALAENDLPRAVELLSDADAALGYWGGERPSIKLFNRLNLLRALELSGRIPRAVALRREIETVNPRLIDDLPLPDVDALRRIGDSGLSASFPLREDRHQ